MKEILAYIKDNKNFINKINNHNIPKESIFLTLDVNFCDTSMPNREGIAAVKKVHEYYQHKSVPTKTITTLLAHILTLNNFIFNSKLLLRIKGCAMDTICVSTLCKYLYHLLRREIHLPLN